MRSFSQLACARVSLVDFVRLLTRAMERYVELRRPIMRLQMRSKISMRSNVRVNLSFLCAFGCALIGVLVGASCDFCPSVLCECVCVRELLLQAVRCQPVGGDRSNVTRSL